MTRRERNILFVALVVAVIFMASQGLPAVGDLYAVRSERLDALRNDIAREERLIADTALWQQRRSEIEARVAELGSRVFQGDSVPLISASIQRLVRDAASQAGITITSTGLAESMQSEGWLLVEQELSIVTENQASILRFLDQIDNASPWLGVSTFSIRRNRNQYGGTITVVGFSRTDGAVAPAAAG